MTNARLEEKIIEFTKTDWEKFPTFEHALQKWAKELLAEERKELEQKLEQVKDIIEKLLIFIPNKKEYFQQASDDIRLIAEKFLKELEISEDRLCEYCDQYKSCPDGKRCHTCDNGSKWKRRKEQ